MRIVSKTYQVYTWEELESSVREELITTYRSYDHYWYGHILEDEQDYLGFQAKIVSFDLDRKDLEVKDLRTDLDMMRDSYAKKYFSKSMTKKDYKSFSSELRLIPYLYVDVVRLYRDDSMVEIQDEFSPFYENMNVNYKRLDSFFEDLYADFKHLVLKDLQDAYYWEHSEERTISYLQESEYLKDGTVFYE